MTKDHDAFIRANTKLTQVPLVSSIKLYLAEEAMDLWQRTEDEMERGYGPPPFWAFAWAGGQALARYVTDYPELVRGKRVLDFAAGSGLVGIAAALAGASRVEANDVDCFAGAAIALNARENAVNVQTRIGDLVGSDEPWDVILAGDVAYQQDMATPVSRWLEARAKSGTLVLIGDPGRAYLPREKLRSRASYDVPVSLMLEDATMKRTDVWSFI
ncbi:MAG: class I SAM-dependent methyltransferase [Methylovirgula sp.]